MKIYRTVVGSLDTNCYIVASKENGAIIIDPGDEPEVISEVLSSHNLSPKIIIDTHGHIDHIKADAALKLPVYVHEQDWQMVSDPDRNLMTTFFGSFEPVQPARLLKDADIIELDELKIRVIHTPGHTMGCICLSVENVLFSGDTLFRDGVGRTDFPGSSHALLLESLKKISLLSSDTVVYPGHGPDTTVGRELGEKEKRWINI